MKQRVFTGNCPSCGMVVIVTDATESDPSFLVSQRMIDPTPLTLDEEVACVLVGRPTWTWSCRWQQEAVDLRGLLWWSGRPVETADTRPTVLPEHVCGGRFTSTLQRPRKPPVSRVQPENDQSHQPDLFEAAESEREPASCPF